MTPAPGIHENVPFAKYIEWDAISKSGLATFDVSPAQYQWERQRPKKQTDAMLRGSAADCLLFDGPEEFDRRYIRVPDGMRRDKRTKKYQEFLEAAGDRTPITGAMLHEVESIEMAIRSHPWAAELLGGKTQVSLLVQDQETGLRIKGRLDSWPTISGEPAIADLKITGDPRAEAFGRTAYNLKYHWQAALYCDLLSALLEYGVSNFFLVAVRDSPVHSVIVHQMHPAAIAQGRREYRACLRRFAQCVEANTWPASPADSPEMLDLPGWAYVKEGVL